MAGVGVGMRHGDRPEVEGVAEVGIGAGGGAGGGRRGGWGGEGVEREGTGDEGEEEGGEGEEGEEGSEGEKAEASWDARKYIDENGHVWETALMVSA